MVIQLKNVRIAFCQNLFKAGAMNAGDKPKFSSTLIIPKNDPQNDKIRQVMSQIADEKWTPAKAPAILKGLISQGKVCHRDGDDKAQYDGFDGCMYISASSSTAPIVIDRDKSQLNEGSGKPYAGCYVNASIDIWPQDNNFGKRINATLRGVQFFGDGDAFVGSAPATADDFEDLSDTGEDDMLA